MTITARDIVNQAMKMAGILGVGQTLLAEDSNDGFTALQNMISQWQVRRWLVPSLFDIAMIGNNEKSNRIGPGQYWNTLRPDKILAAYFIQPNNTINNPVSYSLWPMYSYEDYARVTLKSLNSWPTRYFYDNAYPYGNVFIWPIPTPDYEIHLVLKSQLGFSTSMDSATFVGGSGYTDGAHVAVPLIALGDSVGISATANVTIAGGVVTVFDIESGGQFFKINDTFNLDTAIVGAGVGFIGTVTDVNSSLDSDIELAPEYLEALIYNLAVRLGAMYQLPANDDVKKIARTSLKTIVGANTQVPTLMMPSTLAGVSRRRAGIVNANGGVVFSDIGG